MGLLHEVSALSRKFKSLQGHFCLVLYFQLEERDREGGTFGKNSQKRVEGEKKKSTAGLQVSFVALKNVSVLCIRDTQNFRAL